MDNLNNLTKIIWTDALSVGNDVIDRQNLELLVIYNELSEYIVSKGTHGVLTKILSKMTDYGLIQLEKEKKYMQLTAYPNIIQHIKSHKNYIYKVAVFNNELRSVHNPQPINLLLFLKEWWPSHILNFDKEFECFRKQIQP